jgi:hypothetical protein
MRAAIACSSRWRLTSSLPGALLLAAALLGSSASARGSGPDGPEAVRIYLSEEEALAQAYPAAECWRTTEWAPDSVAMRDIEFTLGWRIAEESFRIHEARDGGRSLGQALVVDQLGLYHPITTLVALGPDAAVAHVALMVFRESRGDAVKRRRFLRQYEGKGLSDPIRLNRDIQGVTGATVSARSMNASVRKALAVITAFRAEKAVP